jgi:hypothetical protein
MFNPVDHIEYEFKRGTGWVPVVIRQANLRQAAMKANFGYQYQYEEVPFITNTTGWWLLGDV